MVDLENPAPSQGVHLPCVPAIEFLADIYESDGKPDRVQDAIKVCVSSHFNYHFFTLAVIQIIGG
jgi:hypothetical protein